MLSASTSSRTGASGHGDTQPQEGSENPTTGKNASKSIGTGDLWESILSSVGASKAVAGKTVVVLGDHAAGKSTLISHLSVASGSSSLPPQVDESHLDLALNFNSIDIHDDSDEDTVARLSVYSLSSPFPPYSSLFPHAFSSPLESLVVLVLDWSRPWNFLRSLKEWIRLIQDAWKQRPEWELQEGRDQCEAFVRSSSDQSSTTTTAAALDDDTPLAEGILDANLGVPLVIVCTKADAIATLEREQDFKEEQVDYIQQTLRTISMRYGAALFSVSRARPETFQRLREYLLHRLFATSTTTSFNASNSVNIANTNNTSSASTTEQQRKDVSMTARSFTFPHRANVVDREEMVVPAGWDSWPKIKILREGFDCNALSMMWARANLTDTDNEDDDSIAVFTNYEAIIPNIEADDKRLHLSKNQMVKHEDEQNFLQRHYQALQSEQSKDPRASFQQQRSLSALESGGVVGPMGNTSLNLPSVEKAMDNDSEDPTTIPRPGRMNRKDTSENVSRQGLTAAQTAANSTPRSNTERRPATPIHESPGRDGAGAAGNGGAANVSNEALANFFQSLLNRPKDGSARVSALSGSQSSSSREARTPE